MTLRSALLPLALLFIAPIAVPLSAQALEYAPGTTRYRISTTTKGSQSSPMGNQNFEVGLQQQVTLAVAKQAKDTLRATVTLDSVTYRSSGGNADMTQLRGAKFISLVSPTGKLYSSKAPEGVDPQLAQISESVARFLPSYRGTLAKGATWADTAMGKVLQQGMEVMRTTVSSYEVTGDTVIGAERAFRVQRRTNVNAAGSGTMQGTPIAMESRSTSTGSFLLGVGGHYLGGTSNDDVTVKITILARNEDIHIKQSAQTTIDAIR